MSDKKPELQVVNRKLHVGSIRIMGVGSSSAVLIGDTEKMFLASRFDTPPESVLIGPIVPFHS